MPKFDATTVDPLTYDFTSWGVEAAGTIPEPSSDQMSTFMEVVRRVMPLKEVTNEETGKTESVVDVDKLVEEFGDEPDEAELLILSAIEAVCSGTPTVAEVTSLPFRVKQTFVGWLIGSLLSPEA